MCFVRQLRGARVIPFGPIPREPVQLPDDPGTCQRNRYGLQWSLIDAAAYFPDSRAPGKDDGQAHPLLRSRPRRHPRQHNHHVLHFHPDGLAGCSLVRDVQYRDGKSLRGNRYPHRVHAFVWMRHVRPDQGN